jgi:hypothetical protein
VEVDRIPLRSEDAEALIANEASDILNIKSPRSAVFLAAKRIAAYGAPRG